MGKGNEKTGAEKPPNQEVLFCGYNPGGSPLFVEPLDSDTESSAS